jgi:cation transport ATPase
MKRAQSAKPPIQKLGDQVAAIFVPVVVGIAVLTFVLAYYSFDLSFQKSMLNAIAVSGNILSLRYGFSHTNRGYGWFRQGC